MVKILSSGEIVADDDPRAQQAQSNSAASAAIRNRDRLSRTGVEGGLGANAYRGPHTGHTSEVSLFEAANGRLLALGIPRVPLGYRDIVIEPLVGVAILLALLVFGLPGLLLVGIIFVVRELSSGDGPVHNTLSRWMAGSSGTQSPRAAWQQPGAGGGSAAAQAGPSGASAPAAGPAAPKDSSSAKKTSFGGSGHKLGSG